MEFRANSVALVLFGMAGIALAADLGDLANPPPTLGTRVAAVPAALIAARTDPLAAVPRCMGTPRRDKRGCVAGMPRPVTVAAWAMPAWQTDYDNVRWTVASSPSLLPHGMP